MAAAAAAYLSGYHRVLPAVLRGNLFIFGMGRLAIHLPPIITTLDPDPSLYDDPVPQALVLTAIVISFATTALFLVVLLASRGLTGTDHVDGEEEPEP